MKARVWTALLIAIPLFINSAVVARSVPDAVDDGAATLTAVDAADLTGSVRGDVRDAGTGQPAAGVTVSSGDSVAVTEPDGSYRIDDLPIGPVDVHFKGSAYIEQFARGEVTTGSVTDLGTNLIQALAEPLVVGTTGIHLQGVGWQVDIPPGALSEPVVVVITPLLPIIPATRLGGPISAALLPLNPATRLGMPVIDIAPSGLQFTEPIEVTVDPAIAGIEASSARLSGFDPAILSVRDLPATAGNDGVAARLTDIRGEQIWLDWFDPNAHAEPGPTWCRSYESDVAASVALNYLRTLVLPFLHVRMGAESRRIYSEYLTPGVESLTRSQIVSAEAHDDFRDFDRTRSSLLNVWQKLIFEVEGVPPPLGPPDNPTVRSVADFDDVHRPGAKIGQGLDIEWTTDAFSMADNLAGGIGGAYFTDPSSGTGFSIADERHIIGTVTVMPHADAKGVRTKVELQGDLLLHVLDAIDFCPGNSGNQIQYTLALLAMSRLEATPHPDGGTWAKTVLDEAKVRLDTEGLPNDITAAYGSNDVDGDGVPDQQPWETGAYDLDNCPGNPNPTQADRDDDGIGDRCEPSEYALRGRLVHTQKETWHWLSQGAEEWSVREEYNLNLKDDGTGTWTSADLPGNDWIITGRRLSSNPDGPCFLDAWNGHGSQQMFFEIPHTGAGRLSVGDLTGELIQTTTAVGSNCQGSIQHIFDNPRAFMPDVDAKEISPGRYEIDATKTSNDFENADVDADGIRIEEHWEGILQAG